MTTTTKTKTLHQKCGLCECELLSCKHEPGRCINPAKGRTTIHGTKLCLGCTDLHAERFLKTLPPAALPVMPTVYRFDKAGRRVDVKLYEVRTTRDVFWSPGCNSYILCELPQGHTGRTSFRLPNDQPVKLYSINGAGEVRWEVEPYRMRRAVRDVRQNVELRGDDKEFYLAFKHFNLTVDQFEEE